MFDWPELLIVVFQNLRLSFKRRQSRGWPAAFGTVQCCCVQKGYGFWAPNIYRSVLGYAFRANESRYAGFFALEAEDEETAQLLQKKANGTRVKVRYNPENPDVSLLEDERIFGRKMTQNPHWLP
jgi:hypothetical protein